MSRVRVCTSYYNDTIFCAYARMILTSLTTSNNQLLSRKCAHTTMTFLSHLLSLSSSLCTCPPLLHNSALLDAGGRERGKPGEGANSLEASPTERSLLFLHSGWPFANASTLPPPPPPPLPLSGSLRPSFPGCVA